jgi:glycosyltransferase involved in cell wall biosynthesis
VKVFTRHLAKVKVADGINSLVGSWDVSPEVRAHIDSVLESNQVPASHSSAPSPLSVTHFGVRDYVFYTGNAVERWNPDTARRSGIGGSETAVIEMGRRLAQLGHSVRVYGDCEGIEGRFDGVDYIDHKKYGNLSCDVLITSRRPSAVDDSHNVSAKARVCWVHDIHCGPELTHARAIRIDRFLTLTNWHRDFFLSHHQCVHPDQVSVTRNGIDLGKFAHPSPRDPKRAVYSSSPDRGMQVAITVWPRVRERVPGAELHVFYGFQTWEACANDDQKALIRNLKQMLKDYETAGVVFHGRVSQDVLAQEFLKSSVWPYPTWFSETSCISAMEAQAAGLRIVTSPIAALNETVGPRGTMVPGDWLSYDYQTRFVDAVVDAFNKPGDADRAALQDYAREHFGWDSLAKEWVGMLDGFVTEAAARIMPPYKGVL